MAAIEAMAPQRKGSEYQKPEKNAFVLSSTADMQDTVMMQVSR